MGMREIDNPPPDDPTGRATTFSTSSSVRVNVVSNNAAFQIELLETDTFDDLYNKAMSASAPRIHP
jgi:hypothetical protein